MISALLQAQFEFTEDLAELVIWIKRQGWRCKITECGIAPRRTGVGPILNVKIPYSDSVHKQDGNHYRGLAADVQLFIDLDKDGEVDWIKTGDHPAWVKLDAFWRTLRPENRTGIGFHDSNHVARMWAGVI